MILLTSCILILIACVLCYYYLLLFVALLACGKSPSRAGAPKYRFGLVIPAHNEETVIAAAVRSCLALDYPTELFRVIVVADNCDDRTAEVARFEGALVLVRCEPAIRGKGPALQWAFEQVLAMDVDALVVLDADCRIDPAALKLIDQAMAEGDRVIQANDAVDNPDESALSYALAVGNVIENDFFYDPKWRLGLAVLLRGTGMAFHREILERYPWKARSITEDVEYSFRLINERVPIRFLRDARVGSAFPASGRQLDIQRARWGVGTVDVARQSLLRLLLDGLKRRDLRLFDGGLTLLVAGRSLLPVLMALGVVLSLVSARYFPSAVASYLVVAALVEAFLVFLYFAMGVVRLGLTRRRVLLMSQIPFTAARIGWAGLLGLAGADRAAWRRTPRTGDAPAG